MKWRRGAGLGQVEDRRGRGGGLGGRGVQLGGGGGVVGLLVLLAYLFLGGGGGGFPVDPGVEAFPTAPPAQEGAPLRADSDEAALFVAAVVDDVQGTWKELFDRAGRTYESTRLVLFEGAVSSGCGTASSATGPFYCPADRKVYVDLAFFRELSQRFGAPGDFAQAYVIAHEFGHHVQNVMGVFEDVAQAKRADPDAANELSVRTELQADCLAGVWGHSAYAEQALEPGDLEEGLAAAAAIGDDRLQRQAGGAVNPETWTHGSSEQRVAWFRKGFDSGDPGACDTFSGDI